MDIVSWAKALGAMLQAVDSKSLFRQQNFFRESGEGEVVAVEKYTESESE